MTKKKGLSLRTAIIVDVVCVVLAVALIIGNYFAWMYSGLISVFLSSSTTITTEEGQELCEQVEAEGIVLLKNEDDALPLSSSETKVSLIGQGSVDFVYGGSGSGSVDASSAPTLKSAMEASGFTVNETLWNFYDTGAGSSYRREVPNTSGEGDFAVNEVPQSVYTSSVLSSMDDDDFAIVTIGRSGGESSDIPLTALDTGYTYLQIDDDEQAMLAMACEKFDKVILLVNGSNAIELGFLEDEAYANVKAALWIGGVGQEGLYSVVDVLTGEVNPSGRLVDTYPYDSLSAPSAANLGSYDITNYEEVSDYASNASHYIVYQEGIYVGYYYYETRYEDAVLGQGSAGEYDYDSVVQYPFGYGLSYTEYSYSDFEMEETDDTFEITLTVTNDGTVDGKHVVEIYMQSPYTDYDKTYGVEKPAVELVGFAKTGTIEAKDSEEVTVSVNKEDMKSYDYTNAETYIVDDGTYYFTVGSDAHDAIDNILAAKGAETEGNSDLVATYEQEEFDDETYSVSQETGNEITNQFDDVSPTYYEEECVYVSRSDWEGTLPETAYKNGSWTASDDLISDLNWYRGDEVINDSSMTLPESNSSATSYTVDDLVDADYDDSRWDDIVNQLTFNQMTKLIRLGGYATIAIDRINLPATVDKDGPSGISGTLVGGASTMAWPTEVVMASTWNTDLMQDMGVEIGAESISAGVTGWYAPGANIHRSPYSGRNFEYYSEDGFLSAKIGAAEMRGVRSMGVIAYMKHFALNDQETNRTSGSVYANEQAIREVFLRGFEGIVREGDAIAAMASMNKIGARWSGAHKGLMTYTLRDEWGFEGMVITDQASVSAMFYQDIVSGLWAGTDMWLNTSSSYWDLSDWYDNATVMTYAHNAAKNIIYAVTNSNAVQSYSGLSTTSGSGATWWKPVLIVADVIIWGGAVVGIVLTTVFYLKGRKGKSVTAEKSADETEGGTPPDDTGGNG